MEDIKSDNLSIFIDHQFKFIYNGEFENLIRYNIIRVLQTKFNNVIVSESEQETEKLLSVNDYDVMIITGYSSLTLSWIKGNKTKTICLIYDNNAEKLCELYDSEKLNDIIAYKSRLVFLCNEICTFSTVINNEIKKLYSGYENFGLNINKKIHVLNYDFSKEIIDGKRLIDSKYIIIDSSNNGGTFLLDDFNKLINDIQNIEDIPNIKFIIICNDLPKNIWEKIKESRLRNYFILLKDVSQQEYELLYKYSLSTIFLSSLDTNIDKIATAMKNNSICLLNSLNDVYVNYFNEFGIFYTEKDNLIEIIRDLLRTNKNIKDESRIMQLDGLLNKIDLQNNESIIDIVKKVVN